MNTTLNPQAQDLNETIAGGQPVMAQLLSRRGQAIFFPKKGILSQSAEAKGKKINATAGIGLNDDGTPMALPAIASKISLDAARVFPYAPSYGLPALRQAWKDQIYKKNPSLKAATSLPVVTSGLTHGLSMMAYLFIDEGDTVILPEIFWGNYRLVMEQNYGADFKTYAPFDEEGYNLEGLQQRLEENPGKQIVVLNFPHNPTGYSLTQRESDQVVALLKASAERGNKIAVVMDDAYFGLVYEEGIEEESLFAKLADCHENILAVKADGATKEDYAWGFRVGFLTYGMKGASEAALKAMEDKTAGAIRSNISSCSHLSQTLVLEALTSSHYDQEKADKGAILRRRYDRVIEILEKSGERYKTVFTAMPFNSGYFMCLKLREDLDAESMRLRLLEEYSIGLIATSGLLRIAFSSVPTDQLETIFDAVFELGKPA